MDDSTAAGGPAGMVERLGRATNAHDLEAIVTCFTEDYRNETPAHPNRGFVGREQVRRNWEQILRLVPDVQTRVVRSAVDGDTIWTEMEHSGTRADGSPHLLRGVVIFGVRRGMAEWARFYMEPVEDGTGGVDEAIRQQMGAGGRS